MVTSFKRGIMKIQFNIITKYLLGMTFVGTAMLSAMSFSVNKNYMGYNLIYAYGQIRFGDAYRLKREYQKLNKRRQTIVVFNSNGGVLTEGIKIGRFLKDNRIGSAVKKNGICASSCALAFLGGRSKRGSKLMILPSSSRLGYHSFYYNDGNYVRLNKVQKDTSKILSYTNYVNAPNYLVVKIFDTESKDIYWINHRDRYALGLKYGLGRLSFYNSNSNSKSKTKITSTNINYYKQSATDYIKQYIGTINSLLTSNRGLEFNNSYYALNSIDYKGWLAQNLKYMYLKNIKQKNYNRVSAKIIYALKNGIRVCSNNIYYLTKTYNSGWKILSKEHQACNYKSSKVLKKITRALP